MRFDYERIKQVIVTSGTRLTTFLRRLNSTRHRINRWKGNSRNPHLIERSSSVQARSKSWRSVYPEKQRRKKRWLSSWGRSTNRYPSLTLPLSAGAPPTPLTEQVSDERAVFLLLVRTQTDVLPRRNGERSSRRRMAVLNMVPCLESHSWTRATRRQTRRWARTNHKILITSYYRTPSQGENVWAMDTIRETLIWTSPQTFSFWVTAHEASLRTAPWCHFALRSRLSGRTKASLKRNPTRKSVDERWNKPLHMLTF